MPDVKCMIDQSSAPVRSISNSSDAGSTIEAYATSSDATGLPSRCAMTTTRSTDGSCARISFTFDNSFGVVTMTEPSARWTRSRIGSGPNAENSGATIAPSLRQPKIAK